MCSPVLSRPHRRGQLQPPPSLFLAAPQPAPRHRRWNGWGNELKTSAESWCSLGRSRAG